MRSVFQMWEYNGCCYWLGEWTSLADENYRLLIIYMCLLIIVSSLYISTLVKMYYLMTDDFYYKWNVVAESRRYLMMFNLNIRNMKFNLLRMYHFTRLHIPETFERQIA